MASARGYLLQNLWAKPTESIQLQERHHSGFQSLTKDTKETTQNDVRKFVRNTFPGGLFKQPSAIRRLPIFEELRNKFSTDRQPEPTPGLPPAEAIEVILAKDREEAKLALVEFLDSKLASDSIAQEFYLHPKIQFTLLKMLIVSLDPIGAALSRYLGPKLSSCRARMSRGDGWYFHAITDDVEEHLQALYAYRKGAEARLSDSLQRAHDLESSLQDSSAAVRYYVQQTAGRDRIIQDLNYRVLERDGALREWQGAFERVEGAWLEKKQKVEEYENLKSAWEDQKEEHVLEVVELKQKVKDLGDKLELSESIVEEIDDQKMDLSRRLAAMQEELEQSRAGLRIANDRLNSRNQEVQSLQQKVNDSEFLVAELRDECENGAYRSEVAEQAKARSENANNAEADVNLQYQGNGSEALTNEPPGLYISRNNESMFQFGEAQSTTFSPPATVVAQINRRFPGPEIVPWVPSSSTRALDHMSNTRLEGRSRFGDFFAGKQTATTSTQAADGETSGLTSWAQDFGVNGPGNDLTSSSTSAKTGGTPQLPVALAHSSSQEATYMPSDIDEWDDMYSATPEAVAARRNQLNQRPVLAPRPVNGRNVDDLVSRIAGWNRSPETDFSSLAGIPSHGDNVNSAAPTGFGGIAPYIERDQLFGPNSVRGDNNGGISSGSSDAEEDSESSAKSAEQPQSRGKTPEFGGNAPRAASASISAESEPELVGGDKSESSTAENSDVGDANENVDDIQGAEDACPDILYETQEDGPEKPSVEAESRTSDHSTTQEQSEPTQPIARDAPLPPHSPSTAAAAPLTSN
ncbi:MAG: hypothetical protein Q9160_006742 [Pyrenula sp. 1 TL-2023]